MIKYMENDSQFTEMVTNSKGKLVVDFFATWCQPCRMLGAILEQMQGDIEIVKIDVDKCPLTARQYGVMSVPTIYFFNNGEDYDHRVGVLSAVEIEEILK